MYQLTGNDFNGNPIDAIKRLSDSAWIPFDPANRDYVEYLRWLEEGNTPLPADEPAPPTD